jgi:hypothetical protein
VFPQTGAKLFFYGAQLRRERGAEILRLEQLPDLDLGLAAAVKEEGAALDPFDDLF